MPARSIAPGLVARAAAFAADALTPAEGHGVSVPSRIRRGGAVHLGIPNDPWAASPRVPEGASCV